MGYTKELHEDDLVFFSDEVFSDVKLIECKELARSLQADGVLCSNFEDEVWVLKDQRTTEHVSFRFSEWEYRNQGYKILQIPPDRIMDSLKAFLLTQMNDYITKTMSEIIRDVKKCIEHLGEDGLRMTMEQIWHVELYLAFMAFPEPEIGNITGYITVIDTADRKARELKPVMHYMVIAEELNVLYDEPGSDYEAQMRYFPVFFWEEVAFRIPVRPTELLLTPYDCLEEEEDGTMHLWLRRTLLKGPNTKVAYTIDDDYGLYRYPIPDCRIISWIRWYRDQTKENHGRFLCTTQITSVFHRLTSDMLNQLIREFVEERIVGNPRYDFARYMAGVEEFEPVLGGDARHLALSNLYFQGFSADTCRKIANHAHVSTTEHYFMNIQDTLLASSVMRYVRLEDRVGIRKAGTKSLPCEKTGLRCKSERRRRNLYDITDCEKEGHLADCVGCKNYVPSFEEMEKRRVLDEKLVRERHERFLKMICRLSNDARILMDLDKLLLDLQTSGTRYAEDISYFIERRYNEWLTTLTPSKAS